MLDPIPRNELGFDAKITRKTDNSISTVIEFEYDVFFIACQPTFEALKSSDMNIEKYKYLIFFDPVTSIVKDSSGGIVSNYIPYVDDIVSINIFGREEELIMKMVEPQTYENKIHHYEIFTV